MLRKTPDSVSKDRQVLDRKIKVLRAGIAAARLDPTTEEARASRVTFGIAEIEKLKKEMLKLNKHAKRAFWPRVV